MSTTLGQMVTDGAGKITPHLHLAFSGCDFSRDPQFSRRQGNSREKYVGSYQITLLV